MRNLVTAEMAELLIALAKDSEWAEEFDGIPGYGPSKIAEQARAIAAEIQEALAEEKRLT